MSVDLFEERLAKIRDRFLGALPGKLDATEAALPQMTAEGAAALVGESYRTLHSIAGTGPTVGFPATGAAARAAEACLLAANREQRGLRSDELPALQSALEELRRAAATELGSDP